MHKDHELLDRDIQTLKDKKNALKEDRQRWHSTDFFIEKYAREHLQLAREKDDIYITR
jgi:cell division protein FtsB